MTPPPEHDPEFPESTHHEMPDGTVMYGYDIKELVDWFNTKFAYHVSEVSKALPDEVESLAIIEHLGHMAMMMMGLSSLFTEMIDQFGEVISANERNQKQSPN
jgi:hypothetical protein